MKRLALLLAIALISSSSTPSSFAAPKAGAKCTKVGKTTISKNILLTCVKKGKRLLWSAGKTKLGTVTADEIVRDYLFTLREGLKPTNTNVNLSLSDGIPLELGKDLKKFAELSATYFQQFMILDRRIELIVAAPDEESWVRDRVKSLPKEKQENFLDFYTSRIGGAMGGVTNQGLAYIFLKVNANLNYKNLETRAEFLDGWQGVMFHEMAHVFQSLHSGETSMKTCTVCWYGEGQAEVLSHSHYGSNKRTVTKGYESNRYFGLEEVRNYLSRNGGLNTRSIEVMVDNSLRRDEYCAKHAAALAYNLGRLINEKLIIDFGLRKSIELMTRIGSNSWESVFLEVFGVSQSDWLMESGTPYVTKVLMDPIRFLTIAEANQIKDSIQFNGEVFPPPAKIENFRNCLENGTHGANSSDEVDKSSNGELRINSADNLGNSPDSGVITVRGTGINSIRIKVFSLSTEDLHFDSGILNVSGSPITVPVTQLKCGTTYLTKISVFSEVDGNGKEFAIDNRGQLRTFDC